MPKHRVHTIEFKRQICQEFTSGETLYGLSKRHGICRNLIRVWVAKFEAGEFDEDAEAASLITAYEARIVALERTGQRLEAHEAGLSRDVRAVLERGPELAQGLGQPQGRTALGQAINVERADRLALERTGREMVERWKRLERAFDLAERAYDGRNERDLGAHLSMPDEVSPFAEVNFPRFSISRPADRRGAVWAVVRGASGRPPGMAS